MSTAAEDGSSGEPPAGPEDLRARDWVAVAKRTGKEFLADDCMGLAQQIAFSSLLAFFPAVILLIGLLGLFGPGAYEELVDLLGGVAPGAVVDAIELARESSAGKPVGASIALLAGTFGAVWAASGAMNAVIKAVNRAYDRLETRPFWKVRAIAIVLVLLTGFVTAGLFLLIVFGGPLGEAIADQANLGSAFEIAWNVARWPIAFAAILLFFAIVFYLAPNREQRSWKWVTPGSLVGGALWLAVSALFALYTSFSSSYDRTYGSLAGGVILLLWLNYSAFALLFGAELNAELDRQADIRAAGGPRAGLTTPGKRTR
ncbi:MAG: YihY/virulence factor BrkB family protein [Gaiellaceae bacterium]